MARPIQCNALSPAPCAASGYAPGGNKASVTYAHWSALHCLVPVAIAPGVSSTSSATSSVMHHRCNRQLTSQKCRHCSATSRTPMQKFCTNSAGHSQTSSRNASCARQLPMPLAVQPNSRLTMSTSNLLSLGA